MLYIMLYYFEQT